VTNMSVASPISNHLVIPAEQSAQPSKRTGRDRDDRRRNVVSPRETGPNPLSVRVGPEPVLRWAREANQRCIEMLAITARQEQNAFPLVTELRELFKGQTPATCQRIADRAYLLVEMELRNAEWWQEARSHPSMGVRRTPSWRGAFRRQAAVALARIILLTVWNSLRVDRDATHIVLGLSGSVADVIGSLRLDEIDRIAQSRYQYVRPRWDDRPAVWRTLLQASQSSDEQAMNEFDIHAIQLLAGELIP
jgi:hypothetical protein